MTNFDISSITNAEKNNFFKETLKFHGTHQQLLVCAGLGLALDYDLTDAKKCVEMHFESENKNLRNIQEAKKTIFDIIKYHRNAVVMAIRGESDTITSYNDVIDAIHNWIVSNILCINEKNIAQVNVRLEVAASRGGVQKIFKKQVAYPHCLTSSGLTRLQAAQAQLDDAALAWQEAVAVVNEQEAATATLAAGKAAQESNDMAAGRHVMTASEVLASKIANMEEHLLDVLRHTPQNAVEKAQMYALIETIFCVTKNEVPLACDDNHKTAVIAASHNYSTLLMQLADAQIAA